jgi:hypothetical protein
MNCGSFLLETNTRTGSSLSLIQLRKRAVFEIARRLNQDDEKLGKELIRDFMKKV